MGADAVEDSEALVHLAHGMGGAPSVVFCTQWGLRKCCVDGEMSRRMK